MKLERDQFEQLHAEVIDDLYLIYKQFFKGPHRLGEFKEMVKWKIYEELNKLEDAKKNNTK